MPTRQDTFDTVYKHLVQQGKPSKLKGQCRYRGKKNRKCAIGRLIPDKLYTTNMESLNIDTLIGTSFDLPKYFKKQQGLLIKLQRVHDTYLSWSKKGFSRFGHAEMKSLASQYRLKYRKPKL